ncbi:MAG: acyl-CoA dehydrogenase family protein [Phycisphaerae bacterium]|nr:acyl-CoA dehydrogenase family protein [Phycisphaerae bacterium]
MEVGLDEEQALLVGGAREFARSELLERDGKWDETAETVAEVLPQLAEMGFMNICIPQELGGLGCSYETYVRILHEIAYASPSTAVTLSVHNMVGNLLNSWATEPQRSEWLSRWGTVGSFSSFAVSEAGAGSDPASCTTRAVKVDGGWKINGEKMWITNGLSGSWFLTMARTAPKSEGKIFTAFMVRGDSPGLERQPIHGKMGVRGSETAVVSYDDVFCPDDHVVGPVGKGMQVAMSGLDGGRVGIAVQATGIAEACLDEMLSYARERKQFGQFIGRFQAIQTMIADSAVELAASKELILRAARRIDAGKVDPVASSMAKLFATEAANRIAYRAVQVHGGFGYVHDYRVEQLYRDARITTIYEGTSEIQRLVIARAVLGR